MGKFKKVKMKEGKVSLIVTKEGELQCDRRLKKKKKRSMGWAQKLLAFAGVAIGYHFGTQPICFPMPDCLTSV